MGPDAGKARLTTSAMLPFVPGALVDGVGAPEAEAERGEREAGGCSTTMGGRMPGERCGGGGANTGAGEGEGT